VEGAAVINDFIALCSSISTNKQQIPGPELGKNQNISREIIRKFISD